MFLLSIFLSELREFLTMRKTMSNTTGQQHKVTEDLQKMGGAVRDAAQEKLGQVGEKAAESLRSRRKTRSTAWPAPASNTSASSR